MTDIADLGMRVRSEDIGTATRRVGLFSKAGMGAERSAKGMTGAIAGASRALGPLGAGLAAAATAALGLGRAVSVLSEFGSAMSEVEAITGATASEMVALRNVAKDLGSTTKYTAAQAAGGLRFLGMAGYSAAESVKAIPAVLDLATAASMGLAEAADTASNIMSAFGIEAENTSAVADVLAKAASSANTDVSQLGMAMAYAGPVAASLGISMSDTAAAVGVLGDAGIQAGRAGTALRASLAALAAPTDKAADAITGMGLTLADVNPETRSLVQIIDALGEAGISTADAMAIFGREAGPAMLALVSQRDSLADLTGELKNADGAAGDMADTMADNLQGDLNSLMSALEGMIITLGDAGLTAALRSTITFMRRMVILVSDLIGMIDSAGDSVKNFLSELFGMGKTADATYRSIDNVTLALNDEMGALTSIEGLISSNAVISREAAQAKLDEAKAIRVKIAAAQDEARSIVESSSAFQELETRALSAQQYIDEILHDARKNSQGGPLWWEDTEDLDFWTNALADIKEEQRTMLREAGALNEPYDRVNSVIEAIERSLARARGEQVSLSGDVANTGTLSARLKAVFDGWSGSINSASGASVRLNNLLSVAAGTAYSLASALNTAARSLGGVGSVLSSLSDSVMSLSPTLKSVSGGLGGAFSSVTGLFGKFADSQALKGAANTLKGLGNTMKMYWGSAVEAAVAQDEFNSSLDDTGGSGGGSAGSATKSLNEYERALESTKEQLVEFSKKQASIREAIDHFGELGDAEEYVSKRTELLTAANKAGIPVTASMDKKIEELARTYAQASKETQKYEKELERLNKLHEQGKDLASGFIDALTSGDISGGLSSFWDDFKQTGANAFSDIVKQGLNGGGMGAITSGFGAAFGDLSAGVSGLMSGGGLASLGTALSGAAPIIGAAMTAWNLIDSFSSTKTIGAGVSGEFGGPSGTTAYDWEKKKHTSWWGLSSSTSTDYDMNSDLTGILRERVVATKESVREMSKSIGVLAGDLSSYTHDFKFSTEGMSQSEIQDRLNSELEEYASKVAAGALHTKMFNREGESTIDALKRMSDALTAVNPTMRQLGHMLYSVSVEGADSASRLVEAFGGLDTFTQSTQAYMRAFYSEAERNAAITRDLQMEMRDLGVAMPRSRAQFRAMVEAIDTGTESGRQLYAEMINMSAAFDQILPQVKDFTAAIERAVEGVNTNIDQAINHAKEQAQAAQTASRAWERAAESLREFLDDLLTTDLTASSVSQNRKAIAARYSSTYSAARGGDVEAAREFVGVAKDYLKSLQSSAATDLEYRLKAGRVQADTNLLAGLSELEQARKSVEQQLYEKQIGLLEELKAYLAAGQLTDARLQEFSTDLGNLQQAIRSVEMINYDFLQKRLDVTVDMIANADVPESVRKLLINAEEGLRSTIDFAVRSSELTPDLRWLAIRGASEHLKTVQFHAKNDMPLDFSKLALKDVTNHTARMRAVLRDTSPGVERLLKAMGAQNGTVNLGGSFEFDPAGEFSDTINNGVANPIRDLRGSLNWLGNVIQRSDEQTSGAVSDIVNMMSAMRAQDAARLQQERLDALARNVLGGADTDSWSGTRAGMSYNKLYDVTNQELVDLARVAGVSLKHMGGELKGQFKSAAMLGNQITRALRDMGLVSSDYFVHRDDPATNDKGQNWWDWINNQPGYATGGTHSGGWRVVGERGWELENTGRSQVVSNSESKQMLDNREVVRELRMLRSQVVRLSELTDTIRVANIQTTENTSGLLRNDRRAARAAQEV